jgi:hypothetical protein
MAVLPATVTGMPSEALSVTAPMFAEKGRLFAEKGRPNVAVSCR